MLFRSNGTYAVRASCCAWCWRWQRASSGQMTWSPPRRPGPGRKSQPAPERTSRASTTGRGWRPGRGHWLLARRSLASLDEISYYACYGPRCSSTADLAWTAGTGQGRDRAGSLPGAHLAGLVCPRHLVDARAGLAVRRPRPGGKRGIGTSDPGMIGYTLAEIRRLLAKISPQQPPGPEHAWSWSRWRRKRQYQARICHYQRRGYALT